MTKCCIKGNIEEFDSKIINLKSSSIEKVIKGILEHYLSDSFTEQLSLEIMVHLHGGDQLND